MRLYEHVQIEQKMKSQFRREKEFEIDQGEKKQTNDRGKYELACIVIDNTCCIRGDWRQ